MFSNPEVVRLIQSSFVAYAGDQWYLHRQQDVDGQFFRTVARQGHRKDAPEDETLQGIYVAAPDGRLVVSDHYRTSAVATSQLLQRAVQLWARPQGEVSVAANTQPDRRYQRVPPEGGLILDVFARIARDPEPGAKWSPNQAVGRDHMWLTRDEWRALRPPSWRKGETYALPPGIAGRLLRFHLVDNVRGEPSTWRPDEVRESDLKLTVSEPPAGLLTLSGTARLHSFDVRRGYEARVQGQLRFERAGDRFARVDLLSWGEAWGEGTYTRGAPKGRFPLLVAFSLAGGAPADRVPPQGSREISAYMNAER